MEPSLKQRVKLLIAHLGITQLSFEKSIGACNGYVNGLRTNISGEILKRILGTYPNISRNWLVFGEGSMLVDEESVNERITVEGSGNRVAGRDYSEGAGGDGGGDHCTVVAALRSVIEEKNRHIDDLRALVAAKDETIAALKSHLQ